MDETPSPEHSHQARSASNPDPDPGNSTGLEPGTGVPPGETPPDTGSVNPGPSAAGSGRRTATPWVVVGLVVLLALVIMLFFVFRVVDLTG